MGYAYPVEYCSVLRKREIHQASVNESSRLPSSTCSSLFVPWNHISEQTMYRNVRITGNTAVGIPRNVYAASMLCVIRACDLSLIGCALANHMEVVHGGVHFSEQQCSVYGLVHGENVSVKK